MTDENTPISNTETGSRLGTPQQRILHAAIDGHSLAFTGGAGTGRILLLQNIIQQLRSKYANSPDAVVVTAPTGTSASHVGGETVRSFMGTVGMAPERADVLAKKLRYNAGALRRWRRVKILVIDEVSKLEASLFDTLARIASILRRDERPFGGIQVILAGDFIPLPPIATTSVVQFAFQANAWRHGITKIFHLESVYRRRNKEFADILEEIRSGTVSQETVDRFASLSRPLHALNGVEATELLPRRSDADRVNERRLNQLSTPLHVFSARDGSSVTDPAHRDRLLGALPTQKLMTLHVGAQVMLVKSVDKELVSGTIGCITSFVEGLQAKSSSHAERVTLAHDDSDTSSYPSVSFRLSDRQVRQEVIYPQVFRLESPTGEVRAHRTQIPLVLAWAISIQNAKGHTLDLVKIDLQKVFETGQLGIALSRATSLDSLQVLNFHPALIRTHT